MFTGEEKIYDVLICTFPAYEEKKVSARKNDYGNIKKRNVEMWKKQTLKKLKGEK